MRLTAWDWIRLRFANWQRARREKRLRLAAEEAVIRVRVTNEAVAAERERAEREARDRMHANIERAAAAHRARIAERNARERDGWNVYDFNRDAAISSLCGPAAYEAAARDVPCANPRDDDMRGGSFGGESFSSSCSSDSPSSSSSGDF